MAWNIRTTFLYISASVVFLASLHHLRFLRRPSSSAFILLPPSPQKNLIIHEQNHDEKATISIISDAGQTSPWDEETFNSIDVDSNRSIRSEEMDSTKFNVDNVNDTPQYRFPNVSILFPDWETLVVVPSEEVDDENSTPYFCLFNTRETSPARFAGTLLYPSRKTFTCELPRRFRRRLPFRQPMLTKSPEEDEKKYDLSLSSSPELLRWNFIVYDMEETENDVVLFVKGINNRRWANRRPTDFHCVFGDDVHAVRTSVTTSLQEVFRCQRPILTALNGHPIKASIEILQTNQVLPSIAYHTPRRKIAKVDATNSNSNSKTLLCACTMVYNVTKFLREWVIYHSKIGVDKFILYDNGSDDDLIKVVNQLNSEGFIIETLFWLWPKTQEAGFSHAALFANTSCQWMIYIDIDEFMYSPSWSNQSEPSKSLLQSLLPQDPSIGQLMITCYEFGPSNQTEHPSTGVTQGYNCRKQKVNRHKSIVLLKAIHESLLNVIHHFRLKDGYKIDKLDLERAVVNHYKYQAWSEFKTKFRRRVSAYVVDWTQTVNPSSNDRAPGLGYDAVEPEGWADKFCEVYDDRLRDLTRGWFGRQDTN